MILSQLLYLSINVDNQRMSRCLRKVLDCQIKTHGIAKINSIYFGGGDLLITTS